jgi:flagellar basal-body rod modification protein FlgD
MSAITGTGSTTSAATADTTNTTNLKATDKLANEQTFLTLLVAQMKNQDPSQPADSTQFLTQLAQFTQVEQLVGIRQDVSTLTTDATAAAAAAKTTTA